MSEFTGLEREKEEEKQKVIGETLEIGFLKLKDNCMRKEETCHIQVMGT